MKMINVTRRKLKYLHLRFLYLNNIITKREQQTLASTTITIK